MLIIEFSNAFYHNDLKFHWNVTALNVVACLMPPYPYIVHFNVWRALTQRKGRDKKREQWPFDSLMRQEFISTNDQKRQCRWILFHLRLLWPYLSHQGEICHYLESQLNLPIFENLCPTSVEWFDVYQGSDKSPKYFKLQ